MGRARVCLYKCAIIGGTMVWEASRRRFGELKVNGTVWPMECRLVVIDIEFPWTDNRRVTNGRDAIRESMEFGHPLVTLWSELFYFVGRGYAPPRSRVLFVFQPLWRLASLLHPCITLSFENFTLFFFTILTMSRRFVLIRKIIWRNGKFKRLGHCVGLDHWRIRAMRDF